jgi:hypothetical protein
MSGAASTSQMCTYAVLAASLRRCCFAARSSVCVRTSGHQCYFVVPATKYVCMYAVCVAHATWVASWWSQSGVYIDGPLAV